MLKMARKVYACRLPLALASRLEALCELHPDKSRSQLMSDLIDLGLTEVEQAWPGHAVSTAEFRADARRPIYLVAGPFSEFHGLTRKHHLAMAHELSKDDPQTADPINDYWLGDGA
jgi:hypothetical protein